MPELLAPLLRQSKGIKSETLYQGLLVILQHRQT
jgi:hypothetical protein